MLTTKKVRVNTNTKQDELFIIDGEGNLHECVLISVGDVKTIKDVVEIVKKKARSASMSAKLRQTLRNTKCVKYSDEPGETFLHFYDGDVKLFVVNRSSEALNDFLVTEDTQTIKANLPQICSPEEKLKSLGLYQLNDESEEEEEDEDNEDSVLPEKVRKSGSYTEMYLPSLSSETHSMYSENKEDVELSVNCLTVTGSKLYIINKDEAPAFKFVNNVDQDGICKKFVVINTSKKARREISFVENSTVEQRDIKIDILLQGGVSVSDLEKYRRNRIIDYSDTVDKGISSSDLCTKAPYSEIVLHSKNRFFSGFKVLVGVQVIGVDVVGDPIAKFLVGDSVVSSHCLIVNRSKKAARKLLFVDSVREIAEELKDITGLSGAEKKNALKNEAGNDLTKVLFTNQPGGSSIKFISMKWPGKDLIELIVVNTSENLKDGITCVKQNGESYRETVFMDDFGSVKSQTIVVRRLDDQRKETVNYNKGRFFTKRVEITNKLIEVEEQVPSDDPEEISRNIDNFSQGMKFREKEHESVYAFKERLQSIQTSEAYTFQYVVFRNGMPTEIISFAEKNSKSLKVVTPEPKIKEKLLKGYKLHKEDELKAAMLAEENSPDEIPHMSMEQVSNADSTNQSKEETSANVEFVDFKVPLAKRNTVIHRQTAQRTKELANVEKVASENSEIRPLSFEQADMKLVVTETADVAQMQTELAEMAQLMAESTECEQGILGHGTLDFDLFEQDVSEFLDIEQVYMESVLVEQTVEVPQEQVPDIITARSEIIDSSWNDKMKYLKIKLPKPIKDKCAGLLTEFVNSVQFQSSRQCIILFDLLALLKVELIIPNDHIPGNENNDIVKNISLSGRRFERNSKFRFHKSRAVKGNKEIILNTGSEYIRLFGRHVLLTKTPGEAVLTVVCISEERIDANFVVVNRSRTARKVLEVIKHEEENPIENELSAAVFQTEKNTKKKVLKQAHVLKDVKLSCEENDNAMSDKNWTTSNTGSRKRHNVPSSFENEGDRKLRKSALRDKMDRPTLLHQADIENGTKVENEVQLDVSASECWQKQKTNWY